jgi:hypothetical protein
MCSVEGCERPLHCKGYCLTHYQYSTVGRELKPLKTKTPKIEGGWTAEKILAQAIEHGDCRLFKPERNYRTNLSYQGKSVSPYRIVFEHFYGELEAGAQIHHKCANNKCVNPTHLQRTSHAENTGEMLARRDYEARIAHLESKVAALEAQLEKEWSSMWLV